MLNNYLNVIKLSFSLGFDMTRDNSESAKQVSGLVHTIRYINLSIARLYCVVSFNNNRLYYVLSFNNNKIFN